MSGSVAGAEITTFFAPASRCFCAPSRFVKKPVDSSTTSTPTSPHGIAPGSRSENSFTSSPPALITPSPSSSSPWKGPRFESYLSRCAIVAWSPRSFAATISRSPPRSSWARKKLRPIRPKPLIPTRIAIPLSLPSSCAGLSLRVEWVLPAQIAQVRLRVEPTAGDPLDQLARHVLAAMPPEILAQPRGERAELAALELVVQTGDVGRHPLPKLAGDDGAERVGGEVADHADRPMHVLEHADGIVRRLDAEVLLHPLVPDLRQVSEIEGAGQELLLELEAEDDVEVVGRLVRLDPDQRRLDPVDRAVPVVDRRAADRCRERRLQLREEVPPEREAAADHVLPHPALRLMEAERGAMRERRPLQLAGDAVLVEAVSRFVHRPEEPVEVVLEVTGRQPDVRDRDRRGERMDSGVEPPRGWVVAKPLDHLHLELLLALDRERPPAHGALAVPADLGDQRNLLLLQPIEDSADLGRLHAGLEVVEEDVVWLVVVVEALDVATPELDVLLQGGQELREVRILPRLHPDGHRERGGARDLGLELRRHAARLLPLPAHEPDQGSLVGVVVHRVGERSELLQQLSHLVGRQRLVGEAVERRQLLCAHACSAGRHLGLLVPAEQCRGTIEIVDLADPLLQGPNRRCHRREPIGSPPRGGRCCLGR